MMSNEVQPEYLIMSVMDAVPWAGVVIAELSPLAVKLILTSIAHVK